MRYACLGLALLSMGASLRPEVALMIEQQRARVEALCNGPYATMTRRDRVACKVAKECFSGRRDWCSRPVTFNVY
jgi:hypothetical protein